MKSGEKNPDKELYKQLRRLSCAELWEREVAQFDRATPEERRERVAVVRAVGVVFSESGAPEQREAAKPWLRNLLQDPCEKIRRYAMAALPKIGAGEGEEAELLSLLRSTTVEREKKFLGKALEKIGGVATLEELEEGSSGLVLQTEQKVRASLARGASPGGVRLESILSDSARVQIHLRCRSGLEQILRSEAEEPGRIRSKFKVTEVRRGLAGLMPIAPFSLADLYSLRCFGSLNFVLGAESCSNEKDSIEALASIIASPLSLRILKTFTEGALRYRLDFVAQGHRRGAVRDLTERAYALCPEILNDSREAPWTIAIHPAGRGNSVELSPKLTPDPRFDYRQFDVPAASHPPLAACMARLAGRMENEVVWDPFCGSGLELIERAILGGVRSLHGTDRSAEAVAITEKNFAAANLEESIQAKFTCCDFRDYASAGGLGPNSATLIVTNPPMGKRVPIANLGRLIEDLFSVAATVLRPGGRLIFANPLRMESPHRSLKLQSRRIVDFSGFDCSLEVYLKSAR